MQSTKTLGGDRETVANDMMKRRMKNKSNNGEEKEEATDDDRLSSLPDAILINILSLLPIKSVIAMTSLSHQWRGFWTQIDSLEFNTNHFEQKYVPSMLTLINQVVTQITSPCIRKFTLHLSDRCFDELQNPGISGSVTYLESCLHQLFIRNIKQIHIKRLELPSRYTGRCSILKLPSCVFQTPSLVVLELDSIFFYELPTYDDNDDDEIIHLPNLNKLSICLSKYCCKAFSKLIRSCPSLEDLSLSINPWANSSHNEHPNLDIFSQSLKQLEINLYTWSNDTKLLIINAPKLVKFKVYHPVSLDIHFVTNPIALVEAQILNIPLQPPSRKPNLLAKLFERISSVRSLVLCSVYRIKSIVRFPNLTHLTWTVYILGGFGPLLALLEYCPVLEVLILKVEHWEKMISAISPRSVPACLPTRLKRIELELNETILVEDLIVVLEYLVSSAQVMEQLIINMTMSRHQYNKVKCRKEKQLCEQLYMLPRNLLDCQIVFSGIYFNGRLPNGRIVKSSNLEEFHWIND